MLGVPHFESVFIAFYIFLIYVCVFLYNGASESKYFKQLYLHNRERNILNLKNEVAGRVIFTDARVKESFGSDFDIYTRAAIVCLRGRCTRYGAAVTLSPCRTVKVGISAHRPQHILCLKTDTKLTSSLSLSQILWPTFNGKTQRFVVGYWKLSLWLRYVIVNNSCRKSFLSLAFCYSHSLSLILVAAERRGQ